MADGNYVTVANLKTYKIGGESVDLVAFTDTEIGDFINEAEEEIERITNDVFYSKSITEYLDGNGFDRLFFPPVIPYACLSLTSIQEVQFDGSTVIKTYTENTHFKKYDHYLQMEPVGDDPRRNILGGETWPLGSRNLKVVGNFGHASTPRAIQRATSLLALEYLQPGLAQISDNRYTAAEWPDFKISYRGDEKTTGLTTGYAYIDDILSKYINRSHMFQVVPGNRTYSDSKYSI